jgi:6-hydroxycyclohex-1-ene-1-carbonyl-CoA dehydrogenase
MLRWEMREPNAPLVANEVAPPALGPDEVSIRVAGCGICHTDLGFYSGGVRTRAALPIALGHEVSGVVEAAGSDAGRWRGQAVVVPAVIPCGTCDPCRRGRETICPKQIFPGNDIHGGFATHVVVPARGLCPVPPDLERRAGIGLPDVAVLADAVTTPYEAICRSGLQSGDVALFVGVGGVGGFGVQIARALGAYVVALDVNPARLALAAAHGAAFALDVRGQEPGAVREQVRAHLKQAGKPVTEWRIFETSGTKPGQELAWRLLVHGAHLGVVGFTLEPSSIRLSQLMALDARAEGNWGCPPARYPEALDLVLRGQVRIAPYVERRPLAAVNEALADLMAHRIDRRVVLVPDME